MNCVGENIRTKSCLKTSQASLEKFGQKSFAPLKIYLLLHLCICFLGSCTLALGIGQFIVRSKLLPNETEPLGCLCDPFA